MIMTENMYQQETLPAKKRKIDWNGVIIKELRKVFKSAHMKPLKKMSTNGKEENAPWRDWFAAAVEKGVENQLPPDILKKARDRFPIPPQNATQRTQYIDPAMLEVNGSQNYSDMLRDIIPPSAPSPQDQHTLYYLNESHIPHVSTYYDLTGGNSSTQVQPTGRQGYSNPPTSSPYSKKHHYQPSDTLDYSSDSSDSSQESSPFQYQPQFPLFHSSLSAPPAPPMTTSLLSQLLNNQICLTPDSPILSPVQSPIQSPAITVTSSPTHPQSTVQPLPPLQPLQPLQSPLPLQPLPPSGPSEGDYQSLPPLSPNVGSYLQDSQAEECTETPSPLPPSASHPIFRHSDSITELLEGISKKEKSPLSLPPLPPPLSAVPSAHQTSNPLLPTFFPVPITPTHSSPRFSTSPTVSARYHSNSSESSNDLSMFFHETAFLPPILSPRSRSSSVSSAKEEPLSSDFAKPQKYELSVSSMATSNSNLNSQVKESSSPSIISGDKVMAKEIEADDVHAKAVYSSSIMYTHAHQLSDIRLKEDVTPIQGAGMEVLRNLNPVSYNWKSNALEMALTMKPDPDSPPLSTKDITKANTRANTYIQPKIGEYRTNVKNNAKASTKHVNYSDPTTPPSSSSSSSSSHTFSPPSMVRATSVPASLHVSTPHHPPLPLRASSELHLFHHNYQYYRDQEDKYDSDYTDDSEDFSDMEDDDDNDYDDDDYDESISDPKKTVGFIAQDVRNACPNLVNENPQTSVLTIDTVGVLALVVDAVKELDIRTQHVSSPQPPIIETKKSIPPVIQGGVINLCSQDRGNLVLNERALDFLKSLSSVSILSVCGPRRTAKSFFCNMFLPKECNSKFVTVKSTSDCTKGIWIYNRPISDLKGEKTFLIVDAEGIDYSDSNASKLMSLLWLISSVVVYKDNRNLDIQKFEIFSFVRNHIQKMKSEHEPPALAAVIDRDFRINDVDQYINTFVYDPRHQSIGEAIRKCFTYRTLMQLAVPQQHQFETKDFYSGIFYNSFVSTREKLESLLLNFKIGTQDATGFQFATYLNECVHKLNTMQ